MECVFTSCPLVMRLRGLTLCFCAIAAPTFAQQAPDTTVLHPVVITATRIPIEQAAAPASVTVLRGDDLRSRGISTVSQALASVPGLAVVQSGSFGATTSLFARGGESDYVKVLVDGVPVNSPGGAFDFASLTTDNLERIEIVRGPSSVAYGSDAVAGVIQLFTRRGNGPPRGTVDVRGGSFGTREGRAGVSGGSALIGYSLGASARETDGILPFNNNFRNHVESGRLTLAPAGTSIDLTARRTDATYHFPTDGSGAVTDSNAFNRERRTVLGLTALRHLTSRLDLRIVGAAMRLDGGSFNEPDNPSDTTGFSRIDSRTERRSVDLRTDARVATHATLSVGAMVEREQARSSSASQFETFPPTASEFSAHRTNNAGYAQLIGAASRVTYTASGRVDQTDTYGTFVTGRASIALELSRSTSMRAAVGNAFKAPAFEETFSSAFTIGNTTLNPERSLSWEAAVEQRLGSRAVISATYFDQRFRDLIQYVLGDASTNFRGTNENLGAASARGLELEARASALGPFDLGANVTLLRTRVTDAGTGAFGTFVNGERLLRRPARTAALDADYRAGEGLRVGAALRFVGNRDDRDFSNDTRVELPSYTLLDLSGDVSLSALSRALAPVALTARVENALDSDYQSAFNFPAPGRTVLIGLRASLGGRAR